MGKAVAFVSGKGGTGKTSMCAAVATCLAAMGDRVLCIDMDVGLRDLDLALGMGAEPQLPFTDLADGTYGFDDLQPCPVSENLFLLTAPVTKTFADIDEGAFRAFLDRCRERFDWCLLDAPAGIGAGFRLSAVFAEPGRYGSSDLGAGKTVCMEYSSINIAKRFHIGHLSTTMIGNSLVRLHRFFGWRAVGVNHLGDWGTQFGKMIAAYKRWGDHDTVAAGGVDEMVKLYVRFNAEAKENPALDDEGRAWFKKIEDGDPEALEIFNWFKSVTLKDAERVYDMLGVKFDSYAGESFYNDKMQPIIDELKAKGLLVEDKGAQIVDLQEWGMPPALILRSDGATL